MNFFPEEIFLNVLNYLSNSSIINCSKVCKTWNLRVNFYRIKELTLSRRRIDQNNLINLDLSLRDDFRIFKDKLLIMKLFEDLKSLEIDCSDYDINNLIYLTVFINLEKLYLRTTLLIDSNSTIYLPNLKMLFIKFIDYDRELVDYNEELADYQHYITYQIKIDCIQLEYLKFNGFSRYVNVVNPQSIKHLHRSYRNHQYFLGVDYTGENIERNADTNLREYTNLINLDCDDLEAFLQSFILDDVRNLLKLNLILDDADFYHIDFRQQVLELFELKRDNGLDNLTFYINGEELNSLDDVNKFLSETESDSN